MGYHEQTVGGGPATGLASDWVDFLRNGLNSGTFGGGNAANGAMGANPFGSSMGFAGILNDLLAGGAGTIGGNMADMIGKNTERNVNAVRERFTQGGGNSFGTPAAYAESLTRSEGQSQLVNAIGGLQLQALMPLMGMFQQMSSLGVPQAQSVMAPNGLMNFMSALGPLMGGFGTMMGAFRGK